MTRKNTPDAKNRILKAAMKIFAEKSFEGSRIEEIAAEAKVPKSLIYYHFENKAQIFEVLIRNFINEYIELTHIAKDDTHQTKAQELPNRMQHHYRDFAINNADLIRNIFIDSLKKTAKQPIIYKILEALIEEDEKSAIAGNQDHYDRNERLVAEFFTSIIPSYAYLCFGDSFAGYFGMDKKTFDGLFLKVYTETHGAYHKYHL